MSADGKLQESLRSVRQFFADVGQLLVAAEEMMDEHSWKPTGDAGCLYWTSSSVTKGSLWVPRFATRQYICPRQFPRIVAMISVLIDDFEMEEGFEVKEPVVSGSFFVLSDDAQQRPLDRWHGLWFGYQFVEADGTPYSIDATNQDDVDWKESYRWKFMTMFGWPLVEISSQAELKLKIVDPLLQLMESH